MSENEQVASPRSSSETKLRDFKKINNSLMQDALKVWSDIWAELDYSREQLPRQDNQVASFGLVSNELENGFEPSCGWSEFIKKMWVLRSYLDFAKRLSRQ
jgi:hypothetical protein